jgi:thiol-disulfide isomerase/thioredoxin
MNRFITCFILIAFLAVGSNLKANTTPSNIDFYKGSMVDAQKKAKKEGKLFFVDFYADWCAPCKWMEETSFSDRKVFSMLNENYVSLKVNIDEFEGFSLKQEYKVRYLPTILIFNANGDLIDRIEETLSPRKLHEILDNHNNGNTSRPKTKKLNSSPSQKDVKPARDDNFVYPKQDKYRVQVGLYSDFKKTFKYVNELKETFAEPIIVLNDYHDGKIVYKVMIGEFSDPGLAEDYVNILKSEFGISGLVK